MVASASTLRGGGRRELRTSRRGCAAAGQGGIWCHLVESGDGAHGALIAALRIEHASRTPVGRRVAAVEGEVAVQHGEETDPHAPHVRRKAVVAALPLETLPL